MARPTTFSADQILDAARDAVLEHWRETTVAHVREHIAAPVGSIYHRFPSRDALFGSLWARSIRRFHRGLLVAGEIDDPHASLDAMARHVPQFCRQHPADAKALTLYRLPDLLELIPAGKRSAFEEINDDVNALLRRVAGRRYAHFTDRHYQLAQISTRQGPYGLVRPLIGGDVPREFDEICSAASSAILALGD